MKKVGSSGVTYFVGRVRSTGGVKCEPILDDDGVWRGKEIHLDYPLEPGEEYMATFTAGRCGDIGKIRPKRSGPRWPNYLIVTGILILLLVAVVRWVAA